MTECHPGKVESNSSFVQTNFFCKYPIFVPVYKLVFSVKKVSYGKLVTYMNDETSLKSVRQNKCFQFPLFVK